MSAWEKRGLIATKRTSGGVMDPQMEAAINVSSLHTLVRITVPSGREMTVPDRPEVDRNPYQNPYTILQH